MHDHSRWFVDDGKRFVFVNYLERNIFRLESIGGKLAKIDIDDIVGAELVRRYCLRLINRNIAVVNQPLQTRTTPAFNILDQKSVQTFA